MRHMAAIRIADEDGRAAIVEAVQEGQDPGGQGMVVEDVSGEHHLGATTVAVQQVARQYIHGDTVGRRVGIDRGDGVRVYVVGGGGRRACHGRGDGH
jgi:hypothetical protein